MSSNFKVHIVILQYNNSHDTVKCLESVAQLDYPDFETVVVDNASEIKEEEAVRHYLENNFHRSFEFISSGHNLGYAGGNNLGIRHALEHGADYILILNPDTEVEKDLLAKLVGRAESDVKIGIVGPVIDEGTPSFTEASVGKHKIYGGEVSWLKPELHHIKDNRFERPFKSIVFDGRQFLTGACLLVKREVFSALGGPASGWEGFDERYFLYFEDADFCLRVQRAGYKLAIAEDATIYHKVSASTSKLGSPLLLRYHYRNAHLFNFKNGPWWVILALPFWSLLIIIRQLIKLVLFPAKRIASLSIMRGVLDFYSHKFGKIS